MTIEICNPEAEAIIHNWMSTGGFKSTEEVIIQDLKSSPAVATPVRLQSVLQAGKASRNCSRILHSRVSLRPWFECRILPVTALIAERWEVLSGECRLQGKQIKVADGLIVATPLHHKLTIVTRNVNRFGRNDSESVDPA